MMYVCGEKDRCILLANYLIENRATVRSVASQFGVSKSTVHKDITQNLKRVDKKLYYEAKKVLEQNKNERHLRGGEATKNKYKRIDASK